MLALILCTCCALSTPCAGEENLIRHGDTSERKVALTFDDGPSKENLDEILALLKEFDAKATFFVLGSKAEELPDQVKKIHDAGHEIGNHTYSHVYISKISSRKRQIEIEKTEKILLSITGEKPHVFRPPGGYIDRASLETVRSMGYDAVLWSLDTRDWSLPDARKVIENVKKTVKNGDIILFHDLENKNLPTADILRGVLPYLAEEGYSFVTVSALLSDKAE